MTTITLTCTKCDGTGVYTPPSPGEPDVCSKCQGTGKHPSGISASNLEDTLNDILDKLNDIKEVVDQL